MAVVGGIDIHRAQVTFDYVDLDSGEVIRGRIAPADREQLRRWLHRFAGRPDVAFALEGATSSAQADPGPRVAPGLRRHRVPRACASPAPPEGTPAVRPMLGMAPERAARKAVRERRSGPGRTVAVPRVLGMARLLALPPLAQLLELGLRAASPAQLRLGTALAIARAPRAAAERDVCTHRPLEANP